MRKILVTGANGQLGKCIQWVVNSNFRTSKEDKYIFVGRDELDITNCMAIDRFLEENDIDIIINCAAFTNVNESQNDILSITVNALGPLFLARCAKKRDIKLIHISTDYVFDGEKNTPYTEDDEVNPVNSYGISKQLGEDYVLGYSNGYVFRTSWLYSSYGRNFLMTMANRYKNKMKTDVVIDQVGTPTSARSLAKFLVWFVENCDEKQIEPGLYHFSNEGVCSWYDFAAAIEDKLDLENRYTVGLKKDSLFLPITTEDYEKKNGVTSVVRPAYSVLSNEKIKKYYPQINHWLKDINEELRFLSLANFWDAN